MKIKMGNYTNFKIRRLNIVHRPFEVTLIKQVKLFSQCITHELPLHRNTFQNVYMIIM